MHRFFPSSAFIAATVGLVLTGCSATTNSAVTPTAQPTPEPISTQLDTGPLPGPLQATPGSGTSFSGLYELQFDFSGEAPAAELVPVRFGQAAGDDFAVDITNFLSLSPCSDCVELRAIRSGAAIDAFELDIAVRHPFPLPTPPLGAFDRYDLHAFDVMGYLLSNGNGTPLAFGSATVAEPFLNNADGYSNLLDGVTEPYFSTPNVTEHPYKLFFEDGTAGNFDAGTHGFSDFVNPTGHNVMPQGSDWSVASFDIQLDAVNPRPIAFAIGVAWGQAVTGRGSDLGQRQQPIFYLPEFHHKAPWKLTANVTANNLATGDTGSSAQLEFALRDWQLGATVDPAWEWMVSDRDSISAASDVASIQIIAPGLELTPVNVDPLSGTGTGVFEDRVFTASVFNSAAGGAGTYYAWIQATDSLAPGPMDVIDRLIGFNTVTDFHTGTLVELELVNAGAPPTAVLNPDPLVVDCFEQEVTLDATGSSDPEDGTNLMYEFDFDLVGGDPLNFTADVGPQASVVATANLPDPLPTHVAVRVADTGGQTDIAVVPVQFNIINLRTPVDVSPFVNGFTQKFNFAIAGGSTSVTRSGDWTFVAANSYNDSARPSTSEIRLWRSMDGQTWETMAALDASGPNWEAWSDYALEADSSGNVYAMIGRNRGPSFGFDWTPEIHVVSGFGTGAWSMVASLPTNSGQPGRYKLFVDPDNDNNILGLWANNGVIWNQFRSTNGSTGPFTHSTPISNTRRDGLEILKHSSGNYHMIGLRVFGGTLLTSERSTDNGLSWSSIGTMPLPPGTTTGDPAGDGIVNPNDPTGDTFQYVFSTRGSGGLRMAQSTDAGVNWSITHNEISVNHPIDPGWPMLLDIAADKDGRMFIAQIPNFFVSGGMDIDGYVHYSDDSGSTWSAGTFLYDAGPLNSWAGMHITPILDGCNMMIVHTEDENIRSVVF